MSTADAHAPFDALALANALPLGVLVTDASGLVLYANAELARMTGHAPHRLIGRPVEDLVPPRLADAHADARARYVADPQPRAMAGGRTLVARRRDGSEFPVEVELRPLSFQGREAVLATVVDCTARRQVEASFRQVMRAAPYGLLLVDPAGCIVMANQRLCEMLGYASTELEGRSVDSLLPERHRGAHHGQRAAYAAAPSARAMGSGRDLTALRQDGVEIPVEIGLDTLETPQGRLVVVAVVDLTARRRAEHQSREAQAQLEEFVYVASHDLRSPLRGVSSLVDFIREDLGEQLAEPVSGHLDRVQQRIQRMERLIHDLLAYARAGQRSVHVERIALGELVEELLALEPPPPGFTLQTDLRCSPFDGARTPLATVLRNLYTNALRHHDRPQGVVQIRAREDGGFCSIDVVDDGPGIPAHVQERVFRLFQTLAAGPQRGSGLGLAVSRRLAEGHGGTLVLRSGDTPRGATFTVRWPRHIRSDFDA